MIPLLRRYLLDNWSSLPLGGQRPRDLSFAIEATGVTKVCCFVFADGDARPRWVAKMARSPQDNAIMAHECQLVETLRHRGSEFLRATVPGPIVTTTIAGHFVVVEPFVAGKPLDSLLPDTGQDDVGALRRCLDPAIDWLLRAQQDVPLHRQWLGTGALRTYLLEPIADMRSTALLTEQEHAYLNRLAEQAIDLVRYPLPLAFKHGDLRLGNILVDGKCLQVIDWEFGAAEALPLMDVFGLVWRTYASRYGLTEIDGYLEDYLAAFDAIFLDGGEFAGLAAEYIARGCQALQIDPAWLEVLFGMFLVTEANAYYRFLQRRAQRGYVYLLRSRGRPLGQGYANQLRRQKNVWLLGHLAEHWERLGFKSIALGNIRAPEPILTRPKAGI